MRTNSMILTAGAVLATLWGPRVSFAVSCGDTIGPNQTVTLTADVICTVPTDPALTIEGPADVDMAGFTVSCDSDNDNGIVLTGTKVELSNGIVTNCLRGLLFEGEGKHKVINMIADGNAVGVGFVAGSARVVLQDSVVSASQSSGVFAFSGGAFKAKLAGNTIVGNVTGPGALGVAGINLSNGGTGALLKNNYVANNVCGGIHVGGQTKLVGNIVIDNDPTGAGSGFQCAGIYLDDGHNKLIKNVVVNSGSNGIEERGPGSRLTKNRVMNNAGNGIEVHGSIDKARISKNVAYGNGGLDLRDANGAGCADNEWKKNSFATSDPAPGSSLACIE